MSASDPGIPGVLIVVGTRPEAIKMAPVAAALRARPEVRTRVLFTGQHTDLVDQVLRAFPLDPDRELGIMRPGQTLAEVGRACLDTLPDVLREWSPDMLLVQGDTATVFFGALTGFFGKLRTGHVEAGLRSGDRSAPWPEEVLRRLTDQLSELHFAPTAAARQNLLAEGADPDGIFVTGNTVVDALLDVRERLGEPADTALARVLDSEHRLVLLTAHRRESFGEPLRRALGAARELIETDPSLALLYPVHPNPQVRAAAEEVLSGHARIHLTEPLGYTDFVRAMERAELILTDSGGVQEEAPTLGTPVLVLREVTERPEALEVGAARLVGTDPEKILPAARRILADEVGTSVPNPFGDGRAGERIADIVVSRLTGADRRTEDWGGP